MRIGSMVKQLLEEVRAVEQRQPVGVGREVRWHPVEDDSDTGTVQGIDEDLSLQFSALARRYYDREQSLVAFPFEEMNNIWNYDEHAGLVLEPVPTVIFEEIMAMRLTAKALALDPTNREALIALVDDADVRAGRTTIDVLDRWTAAADLSVGDPVLDAHALAVALAAAASALGAAMSTPLSPPSPRCLRPSSMDSATTRVKRVMARMASSLPGMT